MFDELMRPLGLVPRTTHRGAGFGPMCLGVRERILRSCLPCRVRDTSPSDTLR
jgi:hypothetical protein